jgi:TM2 domain-containing membrane protein YozV
MQNTKSRGVAIILALFLGGLGVHRFYLGRMKSATLMLLFFWTFIPAIIAIIDTIRFLMMTDVEFHTRYGTGVPTPVTSQLSVVEELEKYAKLNQSGHLSDEEFRKKKEELLK